MSPQLFQYLKRAADEAWFRHEASPHLSAAGTSTGGYRPAVPEDTRHYLTDYQKRAHYDQFRLQLPIYKSRIDPLLPFPFLSIKVVFHTPPFQRQKNLSLTSWLSLNSRLR